MRVKRKPEKRTTVAVSLMTDGVGALLVTSSGLRSAERAMTSERVVRLALTRAGAWVGDAKAGSGLGQVTSRAFENGITSAAIPRDTSDLAVDAPSRGRRLGDGE